MTAQFGERLRFRGKQLAMCATPLDQYFAMGGAKPSFAVTCTALWRGYVGDWEVVDDRLYLTGIDATLPDGMPATLSTVFPNYPDRVFAHWYSGTLRIPQGEYVHAGYASVYEQDLLLKFEKGVLTDARVQANAESGSVSGEGGYGPGAMTVFDSDNSAGHGR
jgi:hypothetical protein